MSWPTSGVVNLDGNTLRVTEAAQIQKTLSIVGPGTISVETLGPALIVGGKLTLTDVTVKRTSGSGGMIQVLPKGRLTIEGGMLSGATQCVGYPAGVDSLGPAIESTGALKATGTTFSDNGFAALSVAGRSRSALAQCVFNGGATYLISFWQDADLALQDCVFNATGTELAAALSGMGNAHAVVQGGSFAGGACASTSNDKTSVVFNGVAFTGQTRIGVQTWGTSAVSLQKCTVADAGGWAIGAFASSSVDVSGTRIARLKGSAVSVDGQAIVTLGPGTRVEELGGGCAVACGASRLVLRDAFLGGATYGVQVTGVGTVEELGATVLGLEPRQSFILGWWIGAVPTGPWIDVDTIVRWVWEQLSPAHPSVENRRAVLEALPARVEWAWAGGVAPPIIASLVDIVRGEAGAIAKGGQSVLDAMLLRGGDPEYAGIRCLLGIGAPLAVVDWRTLRRVQLPAAATAICGDRLGRPWVGDAAGQVTCSGQPVYKARAPISAIAVSAEERPTIAVEAGDGIVWFDDAGAQLHELRSTSSAYCRPVPLPGLLLEYTVSDTSGHPTDRCTWVKRIRPGQEERLAVELSIEQGQTSYGAQTSVVFQDGTALRHEPWGGLVLRSATDAELGRYPGDRVLVLGACPAPAPGDVLVGPPPVGDAAGGTPAADPRLAWIGLEDGTATLIQICKVAPS